MNNSKIVSYNLEEEGDENKIESLKDRQGELSRIVETINKVESSLDWKNLKKILLDGVVETLERQLSLEANKKELFTPEIYRLQGQLLWARKYADLKRLSESLRLQIDNIKNQIYNEQKNPRDGAL